MQSRVYFNMICFYAISMCFYRIKNMISTCWSTALLVWKNYRKTTLVLDSSCFYWGGWIRLLCCSPAIIVLIAKSAIYRLILKHSRCIRLSSHLSIGTVSLLLLRHFCSCNGSMVLLILFASRGEGRVNFWVSLYIL